MNQTLSTHKETNILQTPAPLCPHITSEIIMTTSQQKWEKPTTALSVTGPVYSERSHTRRLFWLLYL